MTKLTSYGDNMKKRGKGRARLDEKSETTRILIPITEKMLKQFDKACKQTGSNRSEKIRTLIQNYITIRGLRNESEKFKEENKEAKNAKRKT